MSAEKGSLPFLRQFLEKIYETRKCPLCARGFDDHAGFERTVKSVSLSSPLFLCLSVAFSPSRHHHFSLIHTATSCVCVCVELSNVPSLLPTLEQKQQELQDRQTRLQELRPKIDEVTVHTLLGH